MARAFDGVFFDIDHTLCYDHQVEVIVLSAMARELVAPHAADGATALLERFTAAAGRELGRARLGEIAIARAAQDCFESLAREAPGAAARAIEPGKLASTFLDRTVERCTQTLEVVDGIGALLADLTNAGYKVALVSNGWLRLQQCKARRIGFGGPLFVSEAIGSWKPDPRIFAHALSSMGLARERTAFAGDSPVADVAGAHGAGMPTIWVNWKSETYPAGSPAPDHRVSTIGELRTLLL